MSGEAITTASTQAFEYPAARVAWRATFVLYFFYLIAMLDRFVITLLQKPIKADLGVSDIELSLLFGGAFALCYALTVLPFGWAVDHYSRRLVMFFAVAFWSLSTAAGGITNSFTGLLLSRAGVGVGESGVTPASHSMLADMFRPDRLSLPLSVWALGAKTGEAFSLFIGGLVTLWVAPSAVYLFANAVTIHGWQLIFLIIGLPGLLFAFLIFTVPEPGRRRAGPAAEASFREYGRFMKRHARFYLGHHGGTALVAIASLGVTSWSPAFFERTFGLSPAVTGAWVGTAILIGPLVGLPLHGALTDWMYRRGMADVHLKYQAGCALVALPFGIGAFTAATPLFASIMLTFFTMSIAGYLSLPACALQLIVPGPLRGKASAVSMLIAGQIAIAFGPISVATITDVVLKDPNRVGESLVIMLSIALPSAALLLGLTYRTSRELARDAFAASPASGDPELSYLAA